MTDRAMESFLRACGAPDPLLVGIEEPGSSSVSWRVLDGPFAVVGRDPGSDLILRDSSVSRRHAYLQVVDGQLFCIDLHSRTGTHWGEETGICGWVQPGVPVRVGPFRIHARADRSLAITDGRPVTSPLPVPISRSYANGPLPDVSLEILGRTEGSSVWRASRALAFIGRSPACKVRLLGSGIANLHASLIRTPGGFFLLDLLSPGGIQVNGERSRLARLVNGDEIAIGSHRIRVRCGAGVNRVAEDPAGWTMPVELNPGRADPGSGELAAFPTREENPESIVKLMMGEFVRLQQDTTNQFQQSLMTILQAFVGAQSEQMALIREELGRIRELTLEQQTLQSNIKVRDLAADGTPSLRLVSGEPISSVGSLGRVSQPRRLAIKGGGTSTPATPPAPVLPPRPPTGVDPVAEDAFHAKVFDRLAEIQGERQGRWQKLMESLLGKGA